MKLIAMVRGWTPARRRLAALGGLLVAMQCVPVERTNPAARQLPDAPAHVLAVLRKHCFDCHSHETRWPWYARIAPASWLISWDVARGREHLNFSQWQEMTRVEQRTARTSVEAAASSGHMPPVQYFFNLERSRPDAAQIAALRAWAASSAASGSRPLPATVN